MVKKKRKGLSGGGVSSFDVEGFEEACSKDRGFMKLLEKSVDDYKQDLSDNTQFSKFHLDDATAEQSQLYSNWAALSATASKYRDFTMTWLDRIKASVELDVRENPEDHDVYPDDKGKIMEAAVRAAVLLNEDVIEMTSISQDAMEYAKLMNGAVSSMDQRKTMIRLEGDLWLGEYYSSVEIKEQVEDEFRGKSKKFKRGSSKK